MDIANHAHVQGICQCKECVAAVPTPLHSPTCQLRNARLRCGPILGALQLGREHMLHGGHQLRVTQGNLRQLRKGAAGVRGAEGQQLLHIQALTAAAGQGLGGLRACG